MHLPPDYDLMHYIWTFTILCMIIMFIEAGILLWLFNLRKHAFWKKLFFLLPLGICAWSLEVLYRVRIALDAMNVINDEEAYGVHISFANDVDLRGWYAKYMIDSTELQGLLLFCAFIAVLVLGAFLLLRYRAAKRGSENIPRGMEQSQSVN